MTHDLIKALGALKARVLRVGSTISATAFFA
jgi:hypothetical protein